MSTRFLEGRAPIIDTKTQSKATKPALFTVQKSEHVTAINESFRADKHIILLLNSIIRQLSISDYGQETLKREARKSLERIASDSVYFETLLELILEVVSENLKGNKFFIGHT